MKWRELTRAAGPAAPLVITVRSPPGAGGDLVAQRLAEQLDLPFVERAIPVAVAEQLSVPVAAADARDEQRETGGGMHPRTVHVRFVASRTIRCRRLHDYAGYDQREALRVIDRTDRARAAYAHHLYGADFSDPDLYDLIVPTDKISIEGAARVVTAFLAASRLQCARPGNCRRQRPTPPGDGDARRRRPCAVVAADMSERVMQNPTLCRP
jgi:cytidylate kinase